MMDIFGVRTDALTGRLFGYVEQGGKTAPRLDDPVYEVGNVHGSFGVEQIVAVVVMRIKDDRDATGFGEFDDVGDRVASFAVFNGQASSDGGGEKVEPLDPSSFGFFEIPVDAAAVNAQPRLFGCTHAVEKVRLVGEITDGGFPDFLARCGQLVELSGMESDALRKTAGGLANLFQGIVGKVKGVGAILDFGEFGIGKVGKQVGREAKGMDVVLCIPFENDGQIGEVEKREGLRAFQGEIFLDHAAIAFQTERMVLTDVAEVHRGREREKVEEIRREYVSILKPFFSFSIFHSCFSSAPPPPEVLG